VPVRTLNLDALAVQEEASLRVELEPAEPERIPDGIDRGGAVAKGCPNAI
jgi:hypothetical protein